MAAGADISATDLKRNVRELANGLVSVLDLYQALAIRIAQWGWPAVEQMYLALSPNTGTQDRQDLEAFMSAINVIVAAATHASGSGQSQLTDNSTGTAATTVSVPAGAAAFVTSDPALVAVLQGLGTDHGPDIRKLAPLPR